MRWVLKCLSIRFRERDGVFLLKTRYLLFLERGMKNRGESMIMSDGLIKRELYRECLLRLTQSAYTSCRC